MYKFLLLQLVALSFNCTYTIQATKAFVYKSCIVGQTNFSLLHRCRNPTPRHFRNGLFTDSSLFECGGEQWFIAELGIRRLYVKLNCMSTIILDHLSQKLEVNCGSSLQSTGEEVRPCSWSCVKTTSIHQQLKLSTEDARSSQSSRVRFRRLN
jgi:hypothetical protein